MQHNTTCDLGKKYPGSNIKDELKSQEIRSRERLLDD